MNDGQEPLLAGKFEWSAPTVVELDVSMEQIEHGFKQGGDGAGGANTSLS